MSAYSFKFQCIQAYLKLFARPAFRKLNQGLVSLGQRGLGIGNCENLEISGELSFLKNLLSQYEAAVIFDVGAHQGDYAIIK